MTPEHRAGSSYHTGVGGLKKNKPHVSPPFKPWLYGKTLPKASPAARAAQEPAQSDGGGSQAAFPLRQGSDSPLH